MTGGILLMLFIFSAQRAERMRIPPEAIEQMMDKGPIQINRAIVTGPLQLRYKEFKYEVSFTDVQFPHPVDFSFSTFERPVTFAGSAFDSSITCQGCVVSRGISFDRAKVNAADLQDLQVGQLRFGGASVRSLRFDNAVVIGNATFADTQFTGSAVFFKTQFMGFADFTGCQFEGGETRFEYASFANNLLFNPDVEASPVRFHHKALFTDIRVGGDAQFEQVVFEEGANFQRAQFEGVAFFNNARFRGDTRFPSANFGSEAQFRSVTFDAAAETDFVDFDNARFMGLTAFDGSRFKLPLTFVSSAFEQGITFDKSDFGKEVSFTAAGSQAPVSFKGTHFREKVAFYGTSFPVVTFTDEAMEGSPDPQFGGPVDLRNFRYDTMTVAWRDLLSQTSYDRQPYAQMEKALRTVGHDEMADEVYLARRIEEGKRLSGDPIRWVLDRLFYLAAGYGVRPLRLLTLCGVLLALGTLMFSRPGTVTLKESKTTPPGPQTLSLPKAFGVAFQYFLPGIDLPGASDWVPEAKPVFMKVCAFKREFGFALNPAFWTTLLLRIPGLIIVPLFLGITTGLLRTFSP